MVRVTAAVVARHGPLVFGNLVEVLDHLLDRTVGPLCPLHRLVEVVDVRLVVLPVVDAHRLLVDRRLERVVVVRQRG